MAMLEYQYKENRGGFYPRSTAINMLCLNLHWDLAGRATLCITQKFNYVFYTLDLPDLYDEWESLFCDGAENSSIDCEHLKT